MSTNNFKRVFVWEMPVRVFHWITVATVTALAITGFIIANPPAIQSSVEATNSYWFGIVRYIHFLSAYLFFVNMIMRIYWSFAGNKFAHWSNFWPFSKKRLKNVMHVLKVDVLLMNEDEHDLTNLSVGHNAVAGFSYAILFLLALVQVFTGFGLYSDMAGWWFPKMFAWVVPALGGDFAARSWHHITMWIMIVFVMIHVYLVFFHDWLEGRGETSSMISGYKFVRKERIQDHESITEQAIRAIDKLEKKEELENQK
ncbi:MAG: Ni/Fe-hydrogenase, b-type cytochrome subunit [Saprospiraceae bacterium]|nr:Ni/Fe-hydrogenase, b-type cytochrome subunit [Saprospiraceae bacterium]